MEKIHRFPIFITVLIVSISLVLAKDLRISKQGINNNEIGSARQGRTFFSGFQGPPPPPPPFMGGSVPIIPPYYPRPPNPIWSVLDGAGSFLMNMLDVVTSTVAEMHLDEGPYGGGGEDYPFYGGGGGGMSYDDSSYGFDMDSSYDGGDYRSSLPMP